MSSPRPSRRLWPLSPSTDRGIAPTAWRLAGLRESAAERSRLRFDRTGADPVVEAYPAAALLLWGLPRDGYKASAEARSELLDAIEAQAPWLAWKTGAARPALTQTTPSTLSSAPSSPAPRRSA